MSRNITTGIWMGLALAFAAIFGGWWGFFLALVLGTFGGLVAAHFDGRIDVRLALDALRPGGRG